MSYPNPCYNVCYKRTALQLLIAAVALSLTWPQAYKLLSCSTQPSMKIIMVLNVKMTTIGISTFSSIINTTSESLKARNDFNLQHFSFYEQMKVHA